MPIGDVEEQMRILLPAADRLGLVPMLVPKAVVALVNTIVQDYNATQKIGHRSQFDEIWDEVADEESRPIDFTLREK